jgi:hypothetical protein
MATGNQAPRLVDHGETLRHADGIRVAALGGGTGLPTCFAACAGCSSPAFSADRTTALPIVSSRS